MGLFDILTGKKKQEEEERAFLEYRQRIEREKREQRIEAEQRKYKQAALAREKYLQEQKNTFKRELDSLPRFNIVLSGNKHNRNASFYAECKNVTKSTPIKKIKDFVAIDTETTGIKAAGNDIIQLSAVKFKNFKPVELFTTYIKPRKSIPIEASAVNGITDDMVADAPLFYQIINSFNTFIEDFPLVAHNAPFDAKHLYVNGLDSIINKTIYDTLNLSKNIIKDSCSYKLQNICSTVGIYFDNAHNASADSLAAGLLFVCLCARRRSLSVAELLDYVDVTTEQEIIADAAPTVESVSEVILNIAGGLVQDFSYKQEDSADFVRLHLYTSGQKIGAVKIIRSDLSITFRRFENGIPTQYTLTSAEDIRNYL